MRRAASPATAGCTTKNSKARAQLRRRSPWSRRTRLGRCRAAGLRLDSAPDTSNDGGPRRTDEHHENLDRQVLPRSEVTIKPSSALGLQPECESAAPAGRVMPGHSGWLSVAACDSQTDRPFGCLQWDLSAALPAPARSSCVGNTQLNALQQKKKKKKKNNNALLDHRVAANFAVAGAHANNLVAFPNEVCHSRAVTELYAVFGDLGQHTNRVACATRTASGSNAMPATCENSMNGVSSLARSASVSRVAP